MENVIEKIKNAGFKVKDGRVYFGEYPKTVKADGVTVSTEADERGYFLGDDGCYYAKAAVKNLCSEKCKFYCGETIVDGKEYYFKVESIGWRVLKTDGDVALLQCDSIIEQRQFDEKNKVYAESEIRRWLTTDFYKKAFSAAEQERVEAVKMPRQACDPSSRDICDKIFLPSFSDVMGTEQEQRILKATDYAIAMGVEIRYEKKGILASYSEENYGDGIWWLSSSLSWTTSSSPIVDNVDFYGGIGSARHVDSNLCGVVPALWIKL